MNCDTDSSLLAYRANFRLENLLSRMSQFLKINLSIYIHILLVLFLWRTLTNIQHFMSQELGPEKLTGIVNGEVRTETKVFYSKSSAVFFQAVLIKDSKDNN